MSNVVGHLNPYPTNLMGPIETVMNYLRDKSSVKTPELVHAAYEGLGVCLGMAFPDNHVHAASFGPAPTCDTDKLAILGVARTQIAANEGAGPVMAGAFDWKTLLPIFLDLLKQILLGS